MTQTVNLCLEVFFGWMSDKMGSKLPMQICLCMGIVGYVIIYASGNSTYDHVPNRNPNLPLLDQTCTDHLRKSSFKRNLVLPSGKLENSYYLFGLGMFWNNFFGNTAGVASIYFGKMFDGQERDAWIGLVMGMAMIGATLGALIVRPPPCSSCKDL